MLKQLPADQVTVLLMKYSEGKKLAEIARSLAIPVGTVKSRLHNALATLKEIAEKMNLFG